MSFAQLLAPFGVALPINKRSLAAGELVLSDLDAEPQAICLIDGVCKVVLLLEQGKEITKSFLVPGDVAVTPYRLNKDYAVFIQAITPVKIELANYQYIRQAAESNEALQAAVANRWTRYETEKEDRFVVDQTLPSPQRYALVIKRLGPWAKQVPLFEIAAYLGITPVQLSRIRKKQPL